MFLLRWHGNPVLPDGLVYEGVSEMPLQVSYLFITTGSSNRRLEQCVPHCTLHIWSRKCDSLTDNDLHMKINKSTSVFHAYVLLSIMNFVITLSKKLWIHEVIAK